MDEIHSVFYPKVSIIIPVYNVSDYIEGCISSVMRQTYPHIECIVVDDVSPDDSIEKCNRLIADYKGPIRFVVLRHERNRGLSAARNTGTDAATGEYIYYLDSDDEITPDCIEKLVAPVIKDSTIEIVQGNFAWIRKDGEMPRPSMTMTSQLDIDTYEKVRKCIYVTGPEMPFYAWAKLISKAFLNKYQIRFKEGFFWEDLLWSLLLTKHLSHLFYVPDVTYLYYRRPHSITTWLKRDVKIHHCSVIYNEIADNLTPGEKDLEVLRYLNNFCQHYLVAKGDERFNHAYSVFYTVLSEKGYSKEVRRLKRVRMISSHAVSRWLFEIALKLYHLYQDIVYLK